MWARGACEGCCWGDGGTGKWEGSRSRRVPSHNRLRPEHTNLRGPMTVHGPLARPARRSGSTSPYLRGWVLGLVFAHPGDSGVRPSLVGAGPQRVRGGG